MRSLFAALMLMTSASFGFAQEKVEPTKEDATEKEMTPREKEFSELQKGFQSEREALIKEYQESKDQAKKDEIVEKATKTIPAAYAPKFLKLAEAEPTDEIALESLAYVLVNGSAGEVDKALALVEKHQFKTESLEQLLPAIAASSSETATAMLESIINKSDSKDIQALAAMSLARRLMEKSDELPVEESLVQSKKAEEVLERIKTEFGDVKYGRSNTEMSKIAEKMLYTVQNLSVGKTIPSLSGENLDGKKETIADYAGKVVVIDMWATWCPPCRAMIPHENEMVKALKDKPFALISISADDKKETLTKFLEETPMPWNHWWVGSQSKVHEALNIEHYPTIYVLDAKGVIRYKEIRGTELEEAVEKLLEEASKTAGE